MTLVGELVYSIRIRIRIKKNYEMRKVAKGQSTSLAKENALKAGADYKCAICGDSANNQQIEMKKMYMHLMILQSRLID